MQGRQPGGPDQSTVELDAGPVSSGRQGPERSVLVLYHRGRGRLVELEPDTRVVVGRAFPSDIIVDDVSLSRQHARLIHRNGEVTIEDLNSRNGTYVGNQRVKTNATVRPGQSVVLGAVVGTLHALVPHGVVLGGLESYESLLAAIESEVLRASELRGSVAVVALRSGDPTRLHASRWCASVRAQLKAVDRLALYGADSALALMPETDAQSAARRAEELRLSSERLLAGFAVYPTGGTSAGELVANALEAMRAANERRPIVAATAGETGARGQEPVAAGAAIQEVFRLARRMALTTAPVLIHGETGTGKEIVATLIHEASPRSKKPFRTVNCAAIPESLIESTLFGHERGAFTGANELRKGFFEQANGGTLFLDEIAELSTAAQAALLRAVETKRITRVGGTRDIEVDVRIVAASHCDLEQLVAAQRFRADLFFRLNTLSVTVPPLRRRREEVTELARHFIGRACSEWGRPLCTLSEAAAAALEAHDFPGNVRELRNIVERAVTIAEAETIDVEHLPERLQQAQPRAGLTEPPPDDQLSGRRPSAGLPDGSAEIGAEAGGSHKDRVRAYESQLILDALRDAGGNTTRAAEILGIPARTLRHKMKLHGIK